MFIYNYIEIENHKNISEDIKKYIIEETDVMLLKWPWKFVNVERLLESVPQLEKIFREFDLKIITAAAIYRPPYSQGGIHIDTSEFYRVLWPVINCETSTTKFFKYEPEKFREGSGRDGDKNLTALSDVNLEFLDEFNLSKPVIFNPKIPHGVYCDPNLNESRISLTLGFNKNPRYVLTEYCC